MNMVREILTVLVLCAGACIGSVNTLEAAGDEPVKVFILAGQSNMEGHGQIRSLDHLGHDPKYGHLLNLLKNEDGSWAVRNDVTISYKAEHRREQKGPLTVGWGASDNEIGPELMFGTIVGQRYEGHVLLIKTAWGGKDAFCDFRSPSAGQPTGDEAALLDKERSEGRNRQVGAYYHKMISEIKECLANIRDVVPGYHGQGYEIVGMAWFQGWNDFCQWPARVEGRQVGLGIVEAYPRNLANMIRDVRKDLGVPDLPVAVGEMGVGGHEMTRRADDPRDREAAAMVAFRNAQKAVAGDPSLKNVTFVSTLDFWDTRLEELRVKAEEYDRVKKQQGVQNTPDNVLPTKELSDEYRRLGGHWYCHYNGSAANYCLIGYALAKAMETDVSLAPTPPMGWNSWNAFEKEIDEEKIKAIADAMVTSGMRDAGYTYLVIDDAWMAKDRDKDGRLVADPVKFPSGMKAIGEYIHSKGLKFGLYEDRGKLTCQQLPGSLGYEQIDMETFAEWGVDYIKMDSCFAESNGRMSSEDYALYRRCIEATGRPIVLSISDFGNAAWAWGGMEYAQLWRTSNDIYPWMDSVYACAETSAGDQAIHPAFNGLWQFAGPGHWNDPDMLQVGNLKHIDADRREIADRAHFSLWCILAAPLMAGNDLRTMSEQTRKVLTAPELIAVNQDPRGVQGYRIFNEEGREVYNKPLADGTTAVLLLNKKRDKADITVRWDQIGLSGSQPVRDLWTRKDLGEFTEGFTARGLGQHEHRMIKVGRPGPPLPGPAPMPLEKYTVTRRGETCLSDLYYIWKRGNTPTYDTAFGGGPITIAGEMFKRGFGCKGKSAFMFMVDGRADRFRAILALDPSSEAGATGRFRVYNEDFFANKVLWDSRDMTKDTPAKALDVELTGVQCLMLVFDGQNALGNWADARVVNESEGD
ncbi:MAG: NPCBM/NEW2 domain-containing protein [Phycisphaerae bacterium]|nr:NPCBM/NEW2 domain-containing protein [Phycisphaerae bacterium]